MRNEDADGKLRIAKKWIEENYEKLFLTENNEKYCKTDVG